MMLFRAGVSVLLTLQVMLVSGCATTSIFSPYPDQMQKVMSRFNAGDQQEAVSSLDRYHKSSDAGLYLLEQGRLAQIAGMYDLSVQSFEAAIAYQQKVEQEARVSATRTAASGASLMTNDNALPYRFSAFERILMYQMQALNFLALGNIEAALVEVRRAEQEQKLSIEDHEDALKKAHEETRVKGFDLQQGVSQVEARYRALMKQSDNSPLSAFQNAWVHYVSGLLYELASQPNDAYIDYKRAFEMLPSNTFVVKDLRRLASNLGMREDLQSWNALQPDRPAEQTAPGREVVILFEQGRVSSRHETRFDLSTPRGWYSVAMPVYYGYDAAKPLEIHLANQPVQQTQLLMDVDQLARKDLTDRMPLILSRQILRLLTKQYVRDKANDQLGPGAAFIATVLGVVTEQSDRRSWLSLPSNGQIARFSVPDGKQVLTFSIQGSSMKESFELEASAPSLSIIRLVQLNSRLYVAPLYPPSLHNEDIYE